MNERLTERIELYASVVIWWLHNAATETGEPRPMLVDQFIDTLNAKEQYMEQEENIMNDNAGLSKAFEVLGDKIAGLESDLKYEQLCKNILSEEKERLQAENSKLESKLGRVEAYIEQAAE